jgi:hemoglobin
MPDIINQADIKILVDAFYHKVRKNHLLANVFDTVMQVNWETHLPKMYQFWEFILFQTGGYSAAPFPVHVEVHKRIPLSPELFDEWIGLFKETVDELFAGENAANIKRKAQNIKAVWSYKFNSH